MYTVAGLAARLISILTLAVACGTVQGQVDFTGNWASLYHEDMPERLPGPELGDYSGIPVNAAARLRGDSYDAGRISAVTEYQCRPHGGDYSMRGLSNMRIEQVLDPYSQRVIAIKTRMNFQDMQRTIWLDGREHPDELAPHTWQGFSTGTWDANMLNVYTTHLKQNYLRRNGLPRSDKATFTEHWVRHGDYLTVTTVIRDAAFLTEPLVRSQSWVLDPGQALGRATCEYLVEFPTEALVPHILPGENPYMNLVPDWYGLPLEGVRGGAETIYPEYIEQIVRPENMPQQCDRYCTCGVNNGPCELR